MLITENNDLIKLSTKSNFIVMLPFAGGNSNSYKEIIKNIPLGIDIICPELPGRGSLSDEPLISDIESLNEVIFNKWIAKLNIEGRYIIFGHSMGAILGFLLTYKIKAAGMKLPERLIVSGREGPSFLSEDDFVHALPSVTFWAKIKDMGGTLENILAENSLKKYFEPILRSDIRAVETYHYLHQKPLNIPISVLYGTDENLSEEAINYWKKETTTHVDILKFDGNHFFILNHAKKIAIYLSRFIKFRGI